ncbi:hypothetical protein ACVVI9_005566, partial [Escherichia coli]
DYNRHLQHKADDLLWWGENQEKDKPRLKSFLNKVGTGIVADTLWLRDDSGDNQDAKREAMVIPPFLGAFKSRGHAACARRCFGV